MSWLFSCAFYKHDATTVYAWASSVTSWCQVYPVELSKIFPSDLCWFSWLSGPICWWKLGLIWEPCLAICTRGVQLRSIYPLHLLKAFHWDRHRQHGRQRCCLRFRTTANICLSKIALKGAEDACLCIPSLWSWQKGTDEALVFDQRDLKTRLFPFAPSKKKKKNTAIVGH